MPLREQKKRDTQCASLFLLVAEVGLVTTGSRGNVCGGVCLVRRGDIRRVRFSPFAICNRGNLSGIDRGYADPVIVHEYVPENDALHLTLRQLVADFSFFKVAKSFPFSHCQSNLRYR